MLHLTWNYWNESRVEETCWFGFQTNTFHYNALWATYICPIKKACTNTIPQFNAFQHWKKTRKYKNELKLTKLGFMIQNSCPICNNIFYWKVSDDLPVVECSDCLHVICTLFIMFFKQTQKFPTISNETNTTVQHIQGWNATWTFWCKK